MRYKSIMMKIIIIIVLSICIGTLNSNILTGTSSLTSNNNVFRFDPIMLTEEPPIGTLVIDLASKLEIADLGDYKFRFYSPNSLTSHYFLIDQLTGQVKTQRSLDREYLCETKACGPCTSTSNCSLPIEIVATTTYSNGNNQHQQKRIKQQQKFVSFDVIIEDKNEFAPQFPKSVLVLNISEAVPPFFTIPIEPATDRDSRQSQITYSLEPVLNGNNQKLNDGTDDDIDPNDDADTDINSIKNIKNYETELKKLNSKLRLSLSSSTSMNSNQQLNLIILEPFDYEQDKEIRFKILASDGNTTNQQLTGSMLVVLKIVDINDNIPIFDRQEYEYRLDENKALGGTRLIRVHANDKDDGLNGLVKYSLLDQSLSIQQKQPGKQEEQTIQTRNLFQIDEQTGWISVAPNVNLDFEQIPIYRLTVKAQDSGLSNSMPVYTNVIIYLNDVNDNKPQINLTLPTDDMNNIIMMDNSKNEIEISEWTMQDTFLVQIIASDLDSGPNGQVKIEMEQFKANTLQKDEWIESNDFSLVHLFNNIYSLMTQNQLDRELYDRYLVNITASDFGQPTQKTTLKLIIKLKDENDNKPVFSYINGISKFDSINNVSYYEINISENHEDQNEWVKLGEIKATDSDIELNGLVTYELDLIKSCNLQYSPMKYFRINSTSGLIEAKKFILDREICEKYTFKLTAWDSSLTNRNKAEINLDVNILDANDNRPIFERSIYEFKLYENKLLNQPFGRVLAHDLDSSNTSFSHIRYHINSPTKTPFRIDPITGDLYLQNELDYELKQSYDLNVIAYDNMNKTPSLNSSCLVRIDVIDVNDNQPKFYLPDSQQPFIYSLNNVISAFMNSTLSLNNNLNNQMIKLLKLNASDLDSDLNGRVVFRLEKQIRLEQKRENANNNKNEDEYAKLFEIDPNTGVISIKLNLKSKNISGLVQYEYDQNITGIYGLVVRISDLGHQTNGGSQLWTKAFLFLVLDDSNQTNFNNEQIKLLKSLIDENRLNDRKEEDYDDDENDYGDYVDDSQSTDNKKFQKIVTLFKYSLVKTIKPYKKVISSNKNDEINIIDYIKEQFMSTFPIDTKNYKYFMMIFLGALLLIILIIASLSVTIYFYKEKQKENRIKELSNEYGGIIIENNKKKNKKNKSSASKSTNSSNSNKNHVIIATNRDNDTTTTLYSKLNPVHQSSSISPSSVNTTSDTTNNFNYSRNGSDEDENMRKLMIQNPTAIQQQRIWNQMKDCLNYDETKPFYAQSCVVDSAMNKKSFIYKDDSAHYSSISKKSISNKYNTCTRTTTNSTNNNSCTNTHSSTIQIMSKLSKRSKELLTSNDLNTSGEEERAILIVNTNSPTTTSNSSSSHSSSNNALTETSNNTSMTTTTLSSNGKKYKTTNQLLVVVPDNSNKIVASAESLTTVNTSTTESSNQSPQQKVETFKTFKTICSPKHNQETVIYKANTPTKCSSKTPTHSAKLATNFDQKPLNLPVNELFKRYELKKQSNDNVITSSFSSINSSSLNSLKLTQRQHLIDDKNNEENNHVNNNINSNNNTSVSTFTTPINRPTLKLTNKVPDYFFKDDKEFKKFQNPSNNIASININMKHQQSSANRTENL